MANKVNDNRNDPKIAVVMVPLPAQGHLNQLLNLSRIISAANIPVHYIGGATHVRQAKLRVHGGWDPASNPNIQFHEFSTPPFNNPPPNPHSQTKFPVQLLPSLSASTRLRHPVFTFVNTISSKYSRVVVIFDSLMSYVVQDIDSVPNVESYCFRSVSAFTVYSIYWDAAGRPDLLGEARIMNEIPSMEGIFPPEFKEFSVLQRGSKKIFSGDLFNSSRAIEGVYLDLLETEKKSGAEKTWALGPFNPFVFQAKNERHKCLEWLDKQEVNSVIFVSFGTTSSLSDEQVQEMAFGLERSGHKFIWVVRDADKGDIFTGEVRRGELPEGFEERVRERGMVVRDWAPQLEILGHCSTGGFMSHCGWNSTTESISMGVPIAAWPMHSDQPGNAFLVTKVLRIGVEVVDWGRRDGVVMSERVENVVRKLMGTEEGEEMRRRAEELGVAVRNSVMEGGSRSKEMDSFITHITR
ncbi:hypothetical protein ACS0TY_031729 [Phlomoides rotata]